MFLWSHLTGVRARSESVSSIVVYSKNPSRRNSGFWILLSQVSEDFAYDACQHCPHGLSISISEALQWGGWGAMTLLGAGTLRLGASGTTRGGAVRVAGGGCS